MEALHPFAMPAGGHDSVSQSDGAQALAVALAGSCSGLSPRQQATPFPSSAVGAPSVAQCPYVDGLHFAARCQGTGPTGATLLQLQREVATRGSVRPLHHLDPSHRSPLFQPVHSREHGANGLNSGIEGPPLTCFEDADSPPREPFLVSVKATATATASATGAGLVTPDMSEDRANNGAHARAALVAEVARPEAGGQVGRRSSHCSSVDGLSGAAEQQLEAGCGNTPPAAVAAAAAVSPSPGKASPSLPTTPQHRLVWTALRTQHQQEACCPAHLPHPPHPPGSQHPSAAHSTPYRGQQGTGHTGSELHGMALGPVAADAPTFPGVSKGEIAPDCACPADNEPYGKIWWPHQSSTNRQANDLNRGIISLLAASTFGGYSHSTKSTDCWLEAAPDLCPRASNATTQRGSVHKHWKRVFDYRYWQLWHAGLAHRYKRPMKGSFLNAEGKAMCPICKQEPDSGGHILGGCKAEPYHSCYIKRHNEAVQLIGETIQHGRNGHGFMLMDATSAANIPGYVTGTRLPQWLLPTVAPDKLEKFRPDILWIPTLTPTQARCPRWLAARMRGDPPGHKVYILEVGYTGDLRHKEKIAEKLAQHAELAALLTEAGWEVQYTRREAITLGVGGTIRNDLAPLLRELSVPARRANACCDNLHHHAVSWLHRIVKMRRHHEAGGPRNQPPPPP